MGLLDTKSPKSLEVPEIIRESGPKEASLAEIDGSVRDPFVQLAIVSDIAEGATVLQAAARAGVSVASLYGLRRDDPEFADRMSDAMEIRRLARVEAADAALWTRGTEGVERDVWYQGAIVGSETQYDTSASRAWLAANEEKYAARTQVDATVRHSIDWQSFIQKLDRGED